MAYTKVFAVRTHFSRLISYAANPDKTDGELAHPLANMVDYATNPDKTEQRLYQSSINCESPETAHLEMLETKKRFGKTKGVLAYHFIQSFAPGEVEPETAHAIGCEFAQRCFGRRFEVVIGTHLDRGHYHNHIVVNSVSCTDGLKYHSSPKTYFGEIRKTSDALCVEYGLSVIEPKGDGKHYAEWAAEKEGTPTIRSLIKVDVDEAILQSFTFNTFVDEMRRRGYLVKWGPNVKHIAVKPPDGQRHLRLYTIGAEYTEEAIRKRIQDVRDGIEPDNKTDIASRRPKDNKKYNVRPHRKPRKLKGFIALYWKYCYLLKTAATRKLPNRVAFSFWEDIRQFDQYQQQFMLLYRNKIETPAELATFRSELEIEADALVQQRRPLYRLRKFADEETQAELTGEIAQISAKLKKVRQKLAISHKVIQSAERLQEQCRKAEQELEQKNNQSTKTEKENNQR